MTTVSECFQTFQSLEVCTDSARLQEELPWERLAQLEAWIWVSWLRLMSVAQSRGLVCGQVTVQTHSQCFEADENKS